MYRIKALAATTFKQSSLDSTKLKPEQQHQVKAGDSFPIAAWALDKNGHIRFTLGLVDGAQLSFNGRNTWIAFAKHVEISRDGAVVSPDGAFSRIAPGRYRLHLSGSGQRDAWGGALYWLAVQQDGKDIAAKIRVISGAPGATPIYPPKDYTGSNAPIYEGVFALGSVERGYWGEAIGGIWISIDPTAPYRVNSRTAIGLHEDANRAWRPGSAGCICPLNSGDTEYIASIVEKLGITELVVNHGQGWLAERGWRG